MKRVGVVGTLVWDAIWTLRDAAAGRAFETWGGMAYSLAAAAAFRPAGWEVVPIVKVGADLEDEARAFFASLPGVTVGPSVVVVPEPNNRVELRYQDEARRTERLSGGVPAWAWHELEPHLAGLDALYVNFLAGWELELSTAERLAPSFRGPLYADLHSLFLDAPGAHARAPRRLPEWRRWLACFDAVQLNADELALLGDEGDSLRVEDLLDHGPRLAIETVGAEGARWAVAADLPADPLRWPEWRGTAGGEIRRGQASPPEWVRPLDPTGCGDVWGATFFLSLLGGATLGAAAAEANRAAAFKLEHRGAGGLFEHFRGRLGR